MEELYAYIPCTGKERLDDSWGSTSSDTNLLKNFRPVRSIVSKHRIEKLLKKKPNVGFHLPPVCPPLHTHTELHKCQSGKHYF